MDEDRIYYVYAHLRKDTNAIFYIGKGKGRRAYARNNRSKWWSSIVAKHGFSAQIIAADLLEARAFDIEMQAIALCRNMGCTLVNLTNGGEGTSGRTCRKDTKDKMRSAATGRKHTEASKAKMRVARTGNVRTFSDEHKRALKISSTGRILDDATKKKLSISKGGKRVLCSDGTVFESVSFAAKWVADLHGKRIYKQHATNISACCKGRRNSAYGYTWSYLEDTLECPLVSSSTSSLPK